MDVQTIVGLVGLTLAITVGGVTDDLRGWLVGFAVPYNPLRVLGNLLSSTMTVGFCAGATWAALTGHDPVLSGGVTAVAAAVSDEVLALLHGIVRRVMPIRPMPMPVEAPTPPKIRAPRNEDEAHEMMDRRDEERGG